MRNQINQEALDGLGFSDADRTALVKTYLVREERRKELLWYELSHDRLIEPILRSNAAWEKGLPIQGPASLWRRRADPRACCWPGMNSVPGRTGPRSTRTSSPLWRRISWRPAVGRVAVERKTDLDELGWGVIFAHDAESGIREALAELLSHRGEGAGRVARPLPGVPRV